jgi:hypothetical protein
MTTDITTNGTNGKPLSRKEHLHILENEIREGMEVFYHVGMKLKRIRDDELYKEDGFGTWEEYCRVRWDWSRPYVQRLITASEYRHVIPSVPSGHTSNGEGKNLDWSERSIRELTRIPDKSGAARVAKKVIEKAEKEGAKLTSTFVRKVVDEELGVKRGPQPPPEPPPEDPQGNFHSYLRECFWDIRKIKEALQPIDQDAWNVLMKNFRWVKILIKECEGLTEILKKAQLAATSAIDQETA